MMALVTDIHSAVDWQPTNEASFNGEKSVEGKTNRTTRKQNENEKPGAEKNMNEDVSCNLKKQIASRNAAVL